MWSHTVYHPRRTSSPVTFRETPLRMRHHASRRSFNGVWRSTDAAASSEDLLSQEPSQVDSWRRRLTRAYLIEAALRDVKMGRPIGRMSMDSVVLGGGKNIATVFSRHLSVPTKSTMAEEGEYRRGRSPERSTRRSRQPKRCTSEHRALLRMKFKLVAKLIIACHKMADEHKLGNQKYEALFPYVRTLHFHDYDDSDDQSKVMIFNPNKYKANKQLRIPEEARRILSKPPAERTQAELVFAKTALLSIKSYAEYPIRMQMKIVEAGMYERYESKRMIIRQGHPPSSFYFILSGSVVVMVQEADFPESVPIGYRGKGDTFGELAMIGQARQSSVISKETIELLSLSAEDYQSIFMFEGFKNLTDPDLLEFLRSLDLLKHWPIEKLINLANPKEAVFMYFPRGEVLVKDSHFSETLVIVKSGSVRVLKKMKRHEPRTQNLKKAIKTPWTPRKIDDQRDKHLLPPIKREENPTTKKGCYILTEVPVPRRLGQTDGARPGIPEVTNMATVHRNSLCGVLRRNVSESARPNDQNYVRGQVDIRDRDQPIEVRSGRRTDLSFRRRTTNDKEREEEKEREQEMMGRKQHIRKIAEDLDSNSSPRDSVFDTEEDLCPQFIHIETLKKGQVFGLANLIFENQPSLCAVSEGAECIMLNKNLFLRHAPDKLITMLKIRCPPYPTENELQEKLERNLGWQKYKGEVLAKTLNNIGTIRIHKNSSSQRLRQISQQLPVSRCDSQLI